MAFTDPSTSVWHRASLLNELVDAINRRYEAASWSNEAPIVAQVVPNTTIVQRATFWRDMQEKISGQIINATGFAPWVQSYDAGSPLSTPTYYDGRSTVDRYANLSDVLQSLGKTGSEYQGGEGGYSWRRRTTEGWETAGLLAYGDVVSNYLVEDLQAVLKALIWTQGSASAWYVSWEHDWPTCDGYGQGFDANPMTALNLAIADYTTGRDHSYTPKPCGLMNWDG
ncbi:unnamed protein product, partial [marine sediment metagenome]